MTITKEGALASFYTVNKAPIKHLRVYFSPKQAGSGDPSPENIRPIEGWEQLSLMRMKKSLYSFLKNTYTANINYYNGYSGWITSQKILDRTQYYTYSVYIDNTNGDTAGGLQIWFRNIDDTAYTTVVPGNFIPAGQKGWSKVTVGPQTFGSTSYYVCWGLSIHLNTVASYPMVELGKKMTEYELYKGSTQTIDWSNDIGTIYGGYIDLITGELVQEWNIIDLGNLDYTYRSNLGGGCFSTYGSAFNSYGRAKEFYHGYCNRYKFVNDYHNLGSLNSGVSWIYENGVAIKDTSITLDDPGEIKVGFSGVKLVYELETPITYQLSPTQLQTFIGQNNIWSNADRVEVEYDLAESNDELYRRRNIILQSAPHLETVSGNIANFSTDVVSPIKEAKIYFNPIQEGSGDPSLENIREIQGFSNINIISCKNNLFNVHVPYYQGVYLSDATTATNLVYISNTDYNVYKIKIKPATKYTFGPIKSGNAPLWATVRTDEILSRFSYIKGGTEGKYITFTSYSSDAYLLVSIAVNGNYKCDNIFQLFEGEEIINYQQSNNYSIIFPTLGKNLLDITRTDKLNSGSNNGVLTISNNIISIDMVASSARTHVLFTQEFPAGTYTIQAKNSGAVGIPKLLSTTEFEGSSYNSYYIAYTRSFTSSSTLTFTLTSTSKIGLVLPNITNEADNPGTLYDIQLESGSTATSYEPYNNTLYGGYVDLVNGKLIQTHQKLTLNGTNYAVSNYGNNSYNGTEATNRGITIPRTNIRQNNLIIDNTCFCDKCTVSKDSIWGNPNNYKWHFTIYNFQQLHICFDNSTVGITTDMDWTERTNKIKDWLAINNITVVLPLETPIEYQLTPQQLKTLKGVNNIWSNANGPISIKYWTH